jgi:hypothetical protein
MPITLHYNRLVPTAFAATTEQAGYLASNLANLSLGRPYRATGNGATDVTLTLAAATAVKTLELHDVNFAAANVSKSSDGIAFNPVGALQTYFGKEGRRRGLINVNDPAAKALRVSIGAGASTDGLAWRIGAAPIFAASLAVASPLQAEYRARWVYPQVRAELANRQLAVAATGIGFHEIELPFEPTDAEDLEPLVRYARAGVVLLELGLANYPWQVWPVRYVEDELEERYGQPKLSQLALKFLEVAA